MINVNDYNLKPGDKFTSLFGFRDPVGDDGSGNGTILVPAGTVFDVEFIERSDQEDIDYYRIHFTYIHEGVKKKSWFSNNSSNSKKCFMNFRVDNLEKLGI